jgi:dTDP-4-dehydrorhamnose 3,5-epimerase
MKLIPTDLPDVMLVEPSFFADERGWFMESFNAAHLDAALNARGLPAAPAFVQDNHSCSRAGVLRGLHYQLDPHAQGKLVRVVKGRVWDVAVDIRRGSPFFGCWAGIELSADNRRQLWIPPGFAHGFLALEDDTHFVYKTTDVYAKQCERSIRWDDPTLAIAWPLLAGQPPQLASKDAVATLFADAEVFEQRQVGRTPDSGRTAQGPIERPRPTRQPVDLTAALPSPTTAVASAV